MWWRLPTGHGSSLQSSVSVSILLSLQFLPPPAGLGLLHSLIRVLLPPSQLDEQESHSDQLPQLPSGNTKKKNMRSMIKYEKIWDTVRSGYKGKVSKSLEMVQKVALYTNESPDINEDREILVFAIEYKGSFK